jgi:hypothetical protein
MMAVSNILKRKMQVKNGHYRSETDLGGGRRRAAVPLY